MDTKCVPTDADYVKQAYIRRLFTNYGYGDCVVFDRYETEYDF